MARCDFYHLQKSRLEDALPLLLAKVIQAGQKAVVIASSSDRVEDLNVHLWSSSRDDWLPHGSKQDGHGPDQPIWLTDDPLDNPNGAAVVVLCEGMDSPLVNTAERTLDLFDGLDEAAVTAARERWAARRTAGFDLRYWQQTDEGRWVEKARHPAGE